MNLQDYLITRAKNQQVINIRRITVTYYGQTNYALVFKNSAQKFLLLTKMKI